MNAILFRWIAYTIVILYMTRARLSIEFQDNLQFTAPDFLGPGFHVRVKLFRDDVDNLVFDNDHLDDRLAF